jgi:hypothetical protein
MLRLRKLWRDLRNGGGCVAGGFLGDGLCGRAQRWAVHRVVLVLILYLIISTNPFRAPQATWLYEFLQHKCVAVRKVFLYHRIDVLCPCIAWAGDVGVECFPRVFGMQLVTFLCLGWPAIPGKCYHLFLLL